MTNIKFLLRAMSVGMALTLVGASPAGALPEMDMTDDGGSDLIADLDGGGSLDDGEDVDGDPLLELARWLRDESDVDLGDGLDPEEDLAECAFP